MFIGALIVASKYLHDFSYKNTAWSSITGLSVNEINIIEANFLKLVDYKLFVSVEKFKSWSEQLYYFSMKLPTEAPCAHY